MNKQNALTVTHAATFSQRSYLDAVTSFFEHKNKFISELAGVDFNRREVMSLFVGTACAAVSLVLLTGIYPAYAVSAISGVIALFLLIPIILKFN